MKNMTDGSNMGAEEEAELINYLLQEDFENDSDEYHPDNYDSPDYGPIGYWDKKKVASPSSHSKLAGDPFAFGHIASAGFDFMFDDIETIVDEDASTGEKMLASAFLFVKPLKLADRGHDFYKTSHKARKTNKVNYTDVIKSGKKMPNHTRVKNKNSLPGKGEPNSSKDLMNPDGNVKQRRYYDDSGNAVEDIDFNHADDGTHTFPHRHKWDWSKQPPRQKGE